MQHLRNTVSGVFSRFTRSSQDEKATEDAVAGNPNAIIIDLEQKPSPNDDQAQQPADQVSNESKKRPRGVEEAGREQKKMRPTTSGQRSNLLANYGDPVGHMTTPIEMPTKETSRTSIAPNTRNRVSSGLHKPMNTLNDSPHVPKTSSGFFGGDRGRIVVGRMPPATLQTLGIRGSNVPSTRRIQGDGFEDDTGRLSKRPKLVNGVASPLPSNGHIDLTEDNTQERHLSELQRRGVEKRAIADAPRTSFSATNDASIASRTDKYTKPEPEKKRRKARNTQGSGQSSVAGTPDDAGRPQRIDTRPLRQAQGLAENLDMDESEDDVRVMLPPPLPDAAKARSKTTTTNGTRLSQAQKPRPGSQQDILDSSDLMQSKALKHASSKRPHESYDRINSVSQLNQRSGAQPKDLSEVTRQSLDDHEGQLRDKFQPIRASDHQERVSRRQGMQATSELPGKRVSTGSEDELAGENNMMLPKSRSTSPQKRRMEHIGTTGKSRKAALQLDSPDPSLRPTAFYSQSKADSKTNSSKARVAQSKRLDDNIEDRIPVDFILCRSCCLREGDIQLVSSSKSPTFLIEHDGVLQKVPNKVGELANINGKEVQKWVEGRGDEVLIVRLLTSMSSNSNGNVMIGFKDAAGRALCHGTLLWASRDTMGSKIEEDVRMMGLVEKLGASIQEDFRKASRPKPAPVASDMALIRSNQKRRTIEQPDDEEILYEAEEPSSRRSIRSRMQGDRCTDVESSRVTSKHFAPPAERRTSRQIKPVKPKTPSPPPPERWSHKNPLGTWSHSVIYPPEGAMRRVTVDSQDIERLDEGEFLNDNLISFALRRIEENMAPEHKDKVLYFNTFFYTALTHKSGRKAFNYDAVKRWTKTKDLLSIPYIVVPINIDLHWFVAIICNLPNLSRKFDDSDLESEAEDEDPLSELSKELEKQHRPISPLVVVDRDASTVDTQTSLRNLSLSDGEAVDLDTAEQLDLAEDSIEPFSSRPSTASGKKSKKKKKAPPRQRTFDPDAPTIVTLDSFGSAHTAEARNLKDYVVAEADTKRNIRLTKEDLQGVTAKGLPEQQNFCDCGLFLVGYIEEFAKDPRRFVTKLLRKDADLKSDFARFDPSVKRGEIRNELLRLHEEQDAARRAQKIAKKSASGVNGEVSKPANVSNTTEAQATEAQGREKKAVAGMKSATSFVPVPPTEADQFKPEKVEALTNDAVDTSSKVQNAESDEIEVAVPRALEGSVPGSF